MKPTDDDEAKADDAASFPHLQICESSSLLICDLCSALFPDDPARFLLMLAIIPFMVCLVAIVFFRERKPVSHLAFGTLRKESSSDEDASNNQDYRSPEPFVEENIHLREEISSKLENFPTEVLEMDLLNGSVAYVYISPHLLSTLYSYYLRGNARMQHVPSLAVQLFLLLNIVGLQMPSEHCCKNKRLG
nr:E3 ubiquitin-protein ligase listerin [Ipomoea batatas]